jgi:hypothetical protein
MTISHGRSRRVKVFCAIEVIHRISLPWHRGWATHKIFHGFRYRKPWKRLGSICTCAVVVDATEAALCKPGDPLKDREQTGDGRDEDGAVVPLIDSCHLSIPVNSAILNLCFGLCRKNMNLHPRSESDRIRLERLLRCAGHPAAATERLSLHVVDNRDIPRLRSGGAGEERG